MVYRNSLSATGNASAEIQSTGSIMSCAYCFDIQEFWFLYEINKASRSNTLLCHVCTARSYFNRIRHIDIFYSSSSPPLLSLSFSSLAIYALNLSWWGNQSIKTVTSTYLYSLPVMDERDGRVFLNKDEEGCSKQIRK